MTAATQTHCMTKIELAKQITAAAGLTGYNAKSAVDAICDTIPRERCSDRHGGSSTRPRASRIRRVQCGGMGVRVLPTAGFSRRQRRGQGPPHRGRRGSVGRGSQLTTRRRLSIAHGRGSSDPPSAASVRHRPLLARPLDGIAMGPVLDATAAMPAVAGSSPARQTRLIPRSAGTGRSCPVDDSSARSYTAEYEVPAETSAPWRLS